MIHFKKEEDISSKLFDNLNVYFSFPAPESCSSDLNAVWIARNQFVVLDKNHVVSLNSFVSFFKFFYGGTDLLLIHEYDHISLYDAQEKRSLASDDSGVFIYTTSNHFKYALINRDHGIIRTLDLLIHVTKLQGNNTKIIKSHVPIYRENLLSGAAHLPEFIGQLCHVTKATEIGKESLDLRISMSQFC
ncbi:unnamed protein product [Rotaria sp. Silwood1]|nr:unnamed protein product [Rotaria sp. Silwood1]